MQHREITSAVVAEIDRLLADGRRHKTIAESAGVSEYVVQVIAKDKDRANRSAPQHTDVASHYPHRSNTVDVATVRMIQRMLGAGVLYHCEIAREVGVSDNFVTQVAQGSRVALDTSRPPLAADEQFLRMPIRCSVCRRRISVVPCRACRAVRESKKSVWCM